nr:uncharacterized protein LOC117689280 [Crassostrea gigas]
MHAMHCWISMAEYSSNLEYEIEACNGSSISIVWKELSVKVIHADSIEEHKDYVPSGIESVDKPSCTTLPSKKKWTMDNGIGHLNFIWTLKIKVYQERQKH